MLGPQCPDRRTGRKQCADGHCRNRGATPLTGTIKTEQK